MFEEWRLECLIVVCKHFQESSALVENDFSKPLKKYHRVARLIDGFSEKAVELILVDILHVTLNVLKGGLCVNFSSHMELVIVSSTTFYSIRIRFAYY